MTNQFKDAQEDLSPTIHRISLNTKFTITSNATHEDSQLSFAAKGLLGYILSRPDNWSIKTWQLAKLYQGNKKGNGYDGIKSMLKELKQEGYLVYKKSRNDKGQWVHRYDVYPMKYPDFQKIIPEVVEPSSEKSQVENAPIIINNEIPSTDLKRSDLIEPQSGKITILDFEGREQALTKQDLFSLAVTQNTDWTAQEIELLHERLAKHKGNVRDLISFCKAIIKKERIVNNINKHTGERPCRQSKVNIQKNNLEKSEKKTQESSEKNESQTTNSEILDKGIGMRLFANWRETL